MAFRFEDSKLWRIALRLTNETGLLAKTFPIEERYSLASQIKRAGD
jgi:hypothetical protein